MPNEMNPAEGERRALVGYIAQYKVAASLIYETLLDESLEWIKITDPEAGQVDDIQIATEGTLDAYQIKWGGAARSRTFNDLINKTKRKNGSNKPSLIQQLAEGWHKLTDSNIDRRVRVSLISRHVPSPTASIPTDELPPLDAHFQGFVRDCWNDKSWVENGLEAIPSGWRASILQLQKETGFNDEVFIKFFKACDLRFQHQLPTVQNHTREEIKRIKDIDHIANLLINLAGDEKRVIQLTRKELLGHLDWENRFKFRSKHKFYIDENTYQPIKNTINKLENFINRYTKGYLALIGSPGAGKSTTLTKTLKYKNGFRVIRYYAFVPDDIQLARGESANFLHDLVLALKKEGVKGKKNALSESREELLEQFSAQLVELNECWVNENTKTLILVDGLDHIEREQQPVRTFLKDLPHPDNIPEGVLFILGSQKLELDGLPPSIQPHLDQEDRVIEMDSLDREAVFSIIETNPKLSDLSSDLKDKIFQLSNGHPLALEYLLQKINLSETRQIKGILDASNLFDDNIENDYEIYWENLGSDSEIRELLALISRLRGVIDLKEVILWVGESVVEKFIKQAKHYFRCETESRWYFFHNSFRQFILKKTGLNIFKEDDLLKHKDYHKKLAEFSSKAEKETVWSWEELYHRASAGDDATALKLGTQTYFRNQFYNFRPLKNILEDTALCIKSAEKLRDGVAYIRIFLIDSELHERSENIGELTLPKLLLELGEASKAVGCIIQNRELRVPEIDALKFCNLLILQGYFEDSRRIYYAAEPLDIIRGAKKIKLWGSEGDLELIEVWASVAHYFLSIETILGNIAQLRLDLAHTIGEVDIVEETKQLHFSILEKLANAVFESDNEEKILEFKNAISDHEDANNIILSNNFDICMKNVDNAKSLTALNNIISWATKQSEIHPEDKILIAELIFRIKKDKATAGKWIENIQQPQLFTNNSMTKLQTLYPFAQRIRFNRMQSALGEPVNPVIAVPNQEDEQQHGMVLFERMIVILANLWGESWRENKLSPTEIIHTIHPALVFFNREWSIERNWRNWHLFKQAIPDFFSFLVGSVAAHGNEAIRELSRTFEAQWNNEETKYYWSRSRKRHIALELYRQGDSIDILLQRLSDFKIKASDFSDLEKQKEESSEQAFAWIEAGQPEHARKLVKYILENSFGTIHHKDYRFYDWMKWFEKINLEQTDNIKDRTVRFASALIMLEKNNRGRGVQDAACKLIKSVALWSPNYALTIRNLLFDQHALSYDIAIEGLLLAGLKSSKPPVELIGTIIKHLIVPFQKNNYKELAKLFTERLYQLRENEVADKTLKSLVEAIETKALPADRGDWFHSIISGLQKLSISTSLLESKLESLPKNNKDNSSTPNITLKNGEKLTEEIAASRINSYDDISAFIGSVSEASYFHWDKLVSIIIEKLTEVEIDTLNEILEPFDPGSAVFALFSKRLSSLDKKEKARDMAGQALKHSSPSGWNQWYDGGTRLEAVKAYINLDSGAGYKKAYNLLLKDYLSRSLFIYSPPSSNLEELLPALFKNPPIVEIWKEIEQQVYQLNEFSNIISLPDGQTNEFELDTSLEEVLIRLLFDDLLIPVPAFQREVHKAICELIRNETEEQLTQKELRLRLLSSVEDEQFIAIAILESVVFFKSTFVKIFENEILLLSNSPSLIIRHPAIHLVEFLNLDKVQVDSSNNKLSPIYFLELPEIPFLNFHQPNTISHEPLPESNDPVEIFPCFDMLSRYSNIPIQNLIARATSIMKTVYNPLEWNKAAEIKIQSWIESVNLNMPFSRPRPAIALRTLGRIIVELADSNQINDQQSFVLSKKTLLSDPAISLIEPVPRPYEINTPRIEEMDTYPIKDWIEAGHEVLPKLVNSINDEYIVLGELSHFVNLTSKKPTESRFMMICHPNWPNSEEIESAFEFFPYEEDWLGSDYPNLHSISDYFSTVIYSKPPQVVLGCQEWLAINPQIPHRLGWKLSSEGTFRWVNNEGVVMVESIWWQDGSPHRQLTFKGIYAEGWLVVASQEAVESIVRLTGNAICLSAIVRKYYDLDEKKIRTKFVIDRKRWQPFND